MSTTSFSTGTRVILDVAGARLVNGILMAIIFKAQRYYKISEKLSI
jgi:hypothetical protein